MAQNKEMKGFQTFLSTKETSFNLSDKKIELFFTVSNKSDKAQKFCTYATPFEGLTGDFIEITGAGGKKLEYTGIMVKRGEAGPEDYLEVPAGGMITTLFSLNDSYEFKKRGKYTVRFSGSEYLNQLPDSNALEISLKK